MNKQDSGKGTVLKKITKFVKMNLVKLDIVWYAILCFVPSKKERLHCKTDK